MANSQFPISTTTQGEYRADVTRDTWNPLERFRRVIVQQGRPVLDADLNEQSAILLHYLECLAQDLGGPHFGRGTSFALGLLTDANNQIDISIQPGRYYAQGLLCEAGAASSYKHQPFTLKPAELKLDVEQRYVLYLDAWEEHVSALQRPAIREVALGGPDTSTRSTVVWQLRYGPFPKPDGGAEPAVTDYDAFYAQFHARLEQDNLLRPGQALLRARAGSPSADTTSPCVTSPSAQYRGPENQLYRVEIHDTDAAGQPSFKWSRENASLLFAVADADPANKTLRLQQGWRDDRFGLRALDWVELVDDEERPQTPRPLAQVIDVDRDKLEIELSAAPDVTLARIQAGHIYLRRWDQRSSQGIVAARFAENRDDQWIELEQGVEVQLSLKDFADPVPGESPCQIGDYWLIPARVATGNVEWPADASGSALQQPAHGVLHRYAPLGVLQQNAQANAWELVDARKLVP